MKSAAKTRFQVAQQDVNPAKLREIIGVKPTGYYSSVATACCDDLAEAGKTIRKNRAASYSTGAVVPSQQAPLM
jgi:hypothetical protein